jgi:hypothetical protein
MMNDRCNVRPRGESRPNPLRAVRSGWAGLCLTSGGRITFAEGVVSTPGDARWFAAAGVPVNYCILRTKKLSTFGSVSGSAQHTFREIDTPNADSTRTHLNTTLGAKSAGELCTALKAALPVKRRKDAVLCIEYLITASPGWFGEATAKTQNEYFKGAIRWLKARHGAANVLCINVQLDETSPHLVAYVAPLTSDGRLSAKEFLGGRSKLSKMQSEFAAVVGAPAGLQRGVEGSKAIHTTNKQYNAALKKNAVLQPPQPPAPSLADRVTGRARAMEDRYAAEQLEYSALVEQARSVVMVSQHARKAQAAALERSRNEAAEGAEHRVEVVRLRNENKALAADLVRQRTYFQGKLDAMKAALGAAMSQVKSLLSEVGLLKRELDSVSDEVHDLRAQARQRLAPSLRK